MVQITAKVAATSTGIGAAGRGCEPRLPAHAALTRAGLEALRHAQVVHRATVRELYLGRLTKHELERLAALFEKALPGVVSASIWPPPQTSA